MVAQTDSDSKFKIIAVFVVLMIFIFIIKTFGKWICLSIFKIDCLLDSVILEKFLNQFKQLVRAIHI